MARAWQFANNRVIGGIHYRSDIEMGRIAGTVIAYDLLQRPDFVAEYERAKAELRHALGYSGS
jgi:acid phosphatase (class A)